ncbi:hypothetical protein T05_3447 [Trichinella murrelli]|uniref:Uncharacterized protein n=1 Tax=Trichinella murrelli TaxID=144512 RepID=A0A0V0U1K6_9BILA|nr:hypothetical protein T05_3447 [Trichinella murrelli]
MFEELVKILHALKHVTSEVLSADSNMVRAMKFKPDLEITAEPYQRILHKIKKNFQISKRSVTSHAIYRQLRRTIRHLRNK